jgi:ADP-heptose:LPS heptosyltransferase
MAESLKQLNDRWIELMCEGRFADAWEVSDAALNSRANLDCATWPRHLQFIWRGESLANQRVLVRCYHGLGDSIQYVRLLAPLHAMARAVSLWVQPSLSQLFSSMPCVDRVLPLHDGSLEWDYDVDIELSELMHALRITPESVGAYVPYIRVAPRASTVVRSNKARVGIVWSSGEWDARRSIPCELLASLETIENVEWIVMQRGPALSQWRHSFGTLPAIPDIVAEARLMADLDLLISVDTCSAHLGGAIGIPVWTLLHEDADWRWMRGRSDAPWYPTMRLIRQTSAGDWRGVLNTVARDLSKGPLESLRPRSPAHAAPSLRSGDRGG